MITLTLGVILWIDAHLFKRILPGLRAGLGDKGKAAVAIASLIAIVLMVIGYRMADGPIYWGRTPMLAGINNLLMLVSIYLFAASGMKLGVARKLRHPMLLGAGIWAFAHLLVNGDLESIILFGGLLVWAKASMVLINRAEPIWEKPEPKPMKKELIGVIAALVTYSVIVAIHMLFGLAVFG